MMNGIIIVNGDAGKFLAENKKTGVILTKYRSPTYNQGETSVKCA